MATTDEITKGIIISYMRQALLTKLQSEEHHPRPLHWSSNQLIDETLRLLVKARKVEKPDWVSQDFSNYYNQLKSRGKHRQLILLLNEAHNDLLIQGIIIPEISYPNFTPSASFVLTAHGEAYVRSGDVPIPEDIDGVINYLKHTIPIIDDVVLVYVGEALQAFERQLTFASAVMLGAASEKTIYLLAEAAILSTCDTRTKNSLEKAFTRRDLPELRRKLKDRIDVLLGSNKIPYGIHEESTDSIFSLFNSIRIQRNDAVHPEAGIVQRPQLRLLLLSFPHICKKAYDLIAWFRKNPT